MVGSAANLTNSLHYFNRSRMISFSIQLGRTYVGVTKEDARNLNTR